MAADELTNEERLDAQRKLSELNSAGGLTVEHFRRLNAAIWQVDDRADLDRLLDLPQPDPQAPTYALVPTQNRAPVHDAFTSTSSMQVERALQPGERPVPTSIGFWGATKRVGRWAAGHNHTSVAVMGGTVLDLRQAAFEGRDIDITCLAFWGGTIIIVPPQMQVRITGIGVMGGFGWEHNQQPNATGPLDPDLPMLTISGLALMGGVQIYRLDYDQPLPDD